MATAAARGGNVVRIYARNAEQVRVMNETRRNPKTLSDFELHEGITATSDLAEALLGAEVIILALPAQTIPRWLGEHKVAMK